MKDSLIEIKNNLQKTKVEAENQINDLEHTEEINTNQNKKQESKKMRII